MTDLRPTVAELLRDGARCLAEAGIDSPRLESRLLLAHSTGLAPEDLIRDLNAKPGATDFDQLVVRRVAREPLAYILGWREFWSLRFNVSPATLIPRPDSETVVRAALDQQVDVHAPFRLLDLGCGTGCLMLAVLHERPGGFGVGVDSSEAAAAVARRNAHDLGLAGQASFICGDWAGAVSGHFDLVLSNPPYVTTAELAGLMPDVARYEPRGALDGGGDGLTAYSAIIATLPRLLTPAGTAVLELGYGQFDAVATIAGVFGLKAESRRDLSGTVRTVILRRSP